MMTSHCRTVLTADPSQVRFSLLATQIYINDFSYVTLKFSDGSVNYYKSLIYLISPWWKELLLQEPSCNRVLLPLTSMEEFMQELELGKQLDLSLDLQEKEESEEKSKDDPPNSLDNSKNSEEIEDVNTLMDELDILALWRDTSLPSGQAPPRCLRCIWNTNSPASGGTAASCLAS